VVKLTRNSFFSFKFKDRIEITLLIVSFLSVLILSLITIFLFYEGAPAFMEIGTFNLLFGDNWAPFYGRYGAAPLIYGSIMIVVGSLVISIPLGVIAAIFFAEFIPRWLGDLIKPFIELLAAIPSIIFGFFGLAVLSPIISDLFGLALGKTAFTASIVLSIMVVPTIVSISSEVISSVPNDYKRASIALGATHWQTLKNVVLPTAKLGIVASILLAFGRAIGETVAVLMVSGAVAKIPVPFWNYFKPVQTITGSIALDMGEVPFGSTHYHALFGLGIVLFVITFVFNTISDYVMRKAPTAEVQI